MWKKASFGSGSGCLLEVPALAKKWK